MKAFEAIVASFRGTRNSNHGSGLNAGSKQQSQSERYDDPLFAQEAIKKWHIAASEQLAAPTEVSQSAR
jgi:hypothetical protein